MTHSLDVFALGYSSTIGSCFESANRHPHECKYDIPKILTAYFRSHIERQTTHLTLDEKYDKLLRLLRTILMKCPFCWYERRPGNIKHWAFYCPSKICKTESWTEYKDNLSLPNDIVCHLCGVPWHPLFRHSTDKKKKCKFTDKLKELAFMVFTGNMAIRNQVFDRLGLVCPNDLLMFADFLERPDADADCINLIDLVVAYYDIHIA
jgi:hypothetical protein